MKRDYDVTGSVGGPSVGTAPVSPGADESMHSEFTGAPQTADTSLTMRLWISNLHAGTLIGKGGTHIKLLREQSGCRVNILEAPVQGAERLMTIVGSHQAIHAAVESVVARIDETHQPPADPAQAPPAADGAPAPPLTYLKLSVSNHHIGGLIGKGGAQIRDFREQSGAGIRVETTPDPAGGRAATLSGTRPQVVEAHRLMILKLSALPPEPLGGEATSYHAAKYQRTQDVHLSAAPPHGMRFYGHAAPGHAAPTHAPPSSMAYASHGSQAAPPVTLGPMGGMGAAGYRPPYAPPSYGGYATQPSGMMPPQAGGQYAPPPSAYTAHPPPQKQPAYGGPPPQTPQPGYGAPQPQQQSEYGGAPQQPQPPAYGGSQHPSYGGPPQQQQQSAYGAPPPPHPGAPYQPPAGYMAPISPNGGAHVAHGVGPHRGPNGDLFQLFPSVLAGRLIGKGGSGIRELREQSKAQIRIQSECEPGTDQRRVTVSGAPEAMQIALALIQARLAQGP